MTRGLYLPSVQIIYDLNHALDARATLLMHLLLTDGNILIVMMMMMILVMMIMIMIMRLIINL